MRVPAILVSPWLDKGVITDTFDHTSLLKFLVDKWSLGNYLGYCVASPLTNTFTKYIRKTPRPTAKSVQTLKLSPVLPPPEQPELTDHQEALVEAAQCLAMAIKDDSVRNQLLRRPAVPTAEARARLAVDQFNAYLLDRAQNESVSVSEIQEEDNEEARCPQRQAVRQTFQPEKEIASLRSSVIGFRPDRFKQAARMSRFAPSRLRLFFS